jgi:predicted RNA-binding protein associated with RNAse of E/G family
MMPSSDDGPWFPGTVIVQEEHWRQKLVTVRPMTVVEDTPDVLALYTPAGAAFQLGTWEAPNRKHLSVEERLRVYLSDKLRALEERTSRNHVLTLNVPGAWHSFKLFWDRDWTLLNWYVNLEAPFLRLERVIIHRDLFLDIVVTPAFDWTWKDEDEFEAVCAAGGLSERERMLVKDEASRMIERIESRRWPFDTPWPDWRPDPAWPAPLLPHNWRPYLPPEE